MKALFIIFVCFIGMGQLIMGQTEKQIREAEQETLEKSRRVLEEIVRYRQNKGDFSRGQVKSLADDLQDLTYWINQLIMAKKSPDWMHPSSERLSEIKRWGEIIKPFNRQLAEEALTSSDDSLYQRLSSESLGVLNFTLPDEELANAVTSRLRETQNLNIAQRAAQILAEHRILEGNHKQLLSKKGAHLTGKAEIKWMGLLSQFGVKSDIKKLVDYLNELQFEGDNPDQYISDIGPVFQAMNGLAGETDQLKIPLQRILYFFNENAPEYSIRIKEEIDSIDYDGPKERKYARNGSGYLDESVDWKSVNSVYSQNRLRPPNEQRPFRSEKKKQGNHELDEETPKSQVKWLWIISGVLLAGILALLLKVFERAK